MISAYAFSIMVNVIYDCVSDPIRNAGSQFVRISSREALNQPSEFLLESVRLFEGELLRVFGKVTVVELGFDTMHGWGEPMVTVVAFGVASFRFAAMGKASIRCAVLLWCEVIALPVPGAVRVRSGLVGGG